jgi:hypothetical protein
MRDLPSNTDGTYLMAINSATPKKGDTSPDDSTISVHDEAIIPKTVFRDGERPKTLIHFHY